MQATAATTKENAAASAAKKLPGAAWVAPLPAETILQQPTLHALASQAAAGTTQDLDFVEVFAGEMAVPKALLAMGKAGASMGLRRDKLHNLLQPVGLITLLALVMRLRPGGLLWMAPVCSTWVWVSRGTTGRRNLTCLIVGSENARARVRES